MEIQAEPFRLAGKSMRYFRNYRQWLLLWEIISQEISLGFSFEVRSWNQLFEFLLELDTALSFA